MAICLDDFKKWGRLLLISILSGTILTYFTCPGCSKSLYNYGVVASFSSTLWFVLWMGSSLLNSFLDKKVSWMEAPLKRFLIGTTITISYTLLAIIGLMETFEFFISFPFGDGYETSIYIAVGITILVSLSLHSRGFLLSWREAAKNAEKLQKESALAKYESLKNQVNPHFLFNSLNALTTLVYEDQDKAVKFIKQLSEVYRYVLDTREREVVSIKEELDFLDAYLFLQKIRFGDNLKISIHISDTGKVAPLALQLLIENAIKHNIVSVDDPLTITVKEEDGFIWIENNLQKKSALGESSTGMGLANIGNRYAFLTDKKVEVIQSEHTFKVKLPIL